MQNLMESFHYMKDTFQGNSFNWFAHEEKNKLLVQSWKMKGWESYSEVRIEFKRFDDDECELTIKQTKIPSGNPIDKLKEGWINQIFKPISILLGYPILSQD